MLRMAISVRDLVRRRGAFVAAVTAAGIGVTMVAQQMIQSIVALGLASMTTAGVDPLEAFASVPAYFATGILPLMLGVFLSLWLLAPIAAELRLFHVVMRSVLAMGIGYTLVFVVSAILGVVQAFSFDGTLFGASFPVPRFYLDGIPGALIFALTSALSSFVLMLPLGILAGVLTWHWLTNHPAKHPVSGMLDEV